MILAIMSVFLIMIIVKTTIMIMKILSKGLLNDDIDKDEISPRNTVFAFVSWF
jgi:hypothetical protein